MSDDRPLEVGERVRWQRMRLSGSTLTLTQYTGTMLETVDHIVQRKDWPVMVMADDNDTYNGRWAIRPSKLHRLPLTDAVAASAEVSATVFAQVADDYDFMMRQANSLGGVELI